LFLPEGRKKTEKNIIDKERGGGNKQHSGQTERKKPNAYKKNATRKKGAVSVLELQDESIGHRDGRANGFESTIEYFS
jgi:hypothetical protein